MEVQIAWRRCYPDYTLRHLDASGGNEQRFVGCAVLSPSPDQTTAGTFEREVDH